MQLAPAPRQRHEARAQLRLALPVLGGQLAQTANGFVDTLMAGRVSPADLGAVAVGASLWVPLFLFMTGVLMTTTPALSRHLGGKDYHRINPIAQQGLWLGLALGLGAMLLFRDLIPRIYTDDAAVSLLAARLLIYAALYQLSDAWRVTASGALRGFEDTRAPMLITLLAYWGIGLPVGYGLGMTDIAGSPMGPDGFWIGLIAGLTAAAVMLGLRLAARLRRLPGTVASRAGRR